MIFFRIPIVVILSLFYLNGNAQILDTLDVLPYESNILWKGKKVTGSHYGQVLLKEGSLVVADGSPVAGTLIVDMTTIRVQDLTNKNMNAKLLRHLKSEDFFDVAQYPQAQFEFDQMSKDGEEKIEGSMVIKGISNKISIPFTSSYATDTLVAQTTFNFDRTRWDIRYGSGNFFSNLGDAMIDDEVSLEITLRAVKRLPNTTND